MPRPPLTPAATRTLRITMAIATLEAGGAERQVVQLAAGLSARGHRVRVVALTRGGVLAGALARAGVEHEVIGKRVKLDPLALIRLVRVLARERPDVLHTHMFTANAYGRAAAALLGGGLACIATEHGPGTDRTMLHRLIDRRLARRTHAVTCPTRALATELQEHGVPPRRLRVVPNAVDLKRLGRQAGGAGARERGLIIAVTRLDPLKDVPVLVEALALLRARAIPARLELLGEGPDRPRIEARVRALGLAGSGAVRLLGHREEVAEHLARASVFCLPSRVEGLSTAVLEAMALGLPIVACSIPGMGELVVPGEHGLLVQPGSAPALASALGRLLADAPLRERMGREAARRVRERFDLPAMVDSFEALYREAIGPA